MKHEDKFCDMKMLVQSILEHMNGVLKHYG